MQRVHFGFEYTGSSDPSWLILDAELSEEVILEWLGWILSGVSMMPARVDEYDAAHPPPEVCVCLPEFFFVVYDLHLLLTLPDLLLQGFGRAFKLEIAVAGGGEAIVEEPAKEKDEDDDVVAGPAVVVVTGLGSSSARFITGLFEVQHSYVEYVPDPRIAQYILSSRKRRTKAVSKQSLPKRRRSTHQISSTGNILVGELLLSLSRVVFLALF